MTKTRFTKWYGWRPDTPDKRDFYFNRGLNTQTYDPVLNLGDAPLPPSIDLRDKCPLVYDQGDLGSCTANAIVGAVEFDMLKQTLQDYIPSRLFLYYNERVIEGTVKWDAGAEIRDGIKSIAYQGDCPEPEWPYNIRKFARKPTAKCYRDAKKHKAVEYYRIETEADMKTCLAAGYPFVFGFSVYDSFESHEVTMSGIVPMPGPDETLLGGHAVMAVGYNDADQRFLVRNSWGTDWGMSGYFTMPYPYLTDRNLSDDFWFVKLVT